MNEYKPKIQNPKRNICKHCKFFEPTIKKSENIGRCFLICNQLVYVNSVKRTSDRCNGFKELIN